MPFRVHTNERDTEYTKVSRTSLDKQQNTRPAPHLSHSHELNEFVRPNVLISNETRPKRQHFSYDTPKHRPPSVLFHARA